MKKQTGCAGLVALVISNPAMTLDFDIGQWKPYVGVDAQVRRMDFRGGFGDNLFQHHSPQGNLYAGVKFNEVWGAEFGYEVTSTRTRVATLTTGDMSAGIVIPPAGSPMVYKSKAQIRGPHVDWTGRYSFYEGSPVQLIGSIGASFFKGTFQRRTLQAGQLPSSTVRTLHQHKILLRLSGGLQYMLGEHFGMRATIAWVNTCKMVIFAKDGIMTNRPPPEIKPKNTTVYGLGVLWAF